MVHPGKEYEAGPPRTPYLFNPPPQNTPDPPPENALPVPSDSSPSRALLHHVRIPVQLSATLHISLLPVDPRRPLYRPAPHLKPSPKTQDLRYAVPITHPGDLLPSLAAARPLAVAASLSCSLALAQAPAPPANLFGYRDFAPEARIDEQFLAIPDATLAGQHLKILTTEPHWASSPEDYKTAQYVDSKFKAAGLDSRIVEYKVMLNKPVSILVEAFDASGKKLMSGPTPEHVDPSDHGGDPFQDDPRVLPAFNGSSPSGDVTGDVVYANHGTVADFKYLADHGIDVKGKIVLVRYGDNFRGVKVYLAQLARSGRRHYLFRPRRRRLRPRRPLPRRPHAPTTPPSSAAPSSSSPSSIRRPRPPPASPPPSDLPDSKRITEAGTRTGPSDNQPSIPVNPLSYKDAEPILESTSAALQRPARLGRAAFPLTTISAAPAP